MLLFDVNILFAPRAGCPDLGGPLWAITTLCWISILFFKNYFHINYSFSIIFLRFYIIVYFRARGGVLSDAAMLLSWANLKIFIHIFYILPYIAQCEHACHMFPLLPFLNSRLCFFEIKIKKENKLVSCLKGIRHLFQILFYYYPNLHTLIHHLVV